MKWFDRFGVSLTVKPTDLLPQISPIASNRHAHGDFWFTRELQHRDQWLTAGEVRD